MRNCSLQSGAALVATRKLLIVADADYDKHKSVHNWKEPTYKHIHMLIAEPHMTIIGDQTLAAAPSSCFDKATDELGIIFRLNRRARLNGFLRGWPDDELDKRSGVVWGPRQGSS